MVFQNRLGGLDVAAPRQHQRELDPHVRPLSFQRGDFLAKRVRALCGLGGFRDLPLQFRDSGIALGQLGLVGGGVHAGTSCARVAALPSNVPLPLRFLLLHALRFAPLLVRVLDLLLRLRAILLTVHDLRLSSRRA